MKIIKTLVLTLFYLSIILITGSKISLAQTYDLVSFMKSKYNYNGFTETNSYLGMIGHRFDKISGNWKYTVPFNYCPPSLSGRCENLNWHFFYQFRQKSGENILYLSKVPWIGKNVEVFWFDQNWIYDFSEPAFNNRCSANSFSCFRNFHHQVFDNPNVEFPNRGYVWFKRFFTSGEKISIPEVKIRYYVDMNFYCNSSDCFDYWPAFFAKANYIPNWRFPDKTCPECYNLPENLDVVVLETEARTPFKFKEKYYYGKSESNVFGMVRFEKWEDKESWCGTNVCCSGICEEDYVLVEYNNFSLLTFYPNGDSDKYFQPNFYSNPKIETNPTNGALPRGKFKLPGPGTLTDGSALPKDNWVYLTEILTDSDYLINSLDTCSGTCFKECPDAYQYLGSFVTDFCDHKNKCSFGWAIFCGTNKDVVLAETCPKYYSSRGQFLYQGNPQQAYDYQRRDISGKTINFCVHYNQFHYPKISFLLFKIKFQGINQQRPNKTIKITIKNEENIVHTENVDIDSDQNGVYSGTISNINQGNYDILIKGWVHLQKKFPGVTLNPGANNQNWSDIELRAGDIDGNNLINPLDVTKVFNDYPQNTTEGDIADLNLDGKVNAIDIGLIIKNYLQQGD